MTAHNLVTYGLAGGACYTVPKLFAYLCTKPDHPLSMLDRLRTQMADLQETIKETVGARAWFIATDIVADNAWISVLVVLFLTQLPFDSFEKGTRSLSAFIGFCAEAYLLRLAITKLFPQLKPQIGVRNY